MSNIVDLVERSKNGDEKAMSEIVTIYKRLIFTLAYRLLNDYDASLDICQETFIKAFRNLNKLKKFEKFKTWLCSIARNLTYDRLRKEKERLKDNNHGESHKADDPATSIRKRVIIQNALDRLNPRDRLLLILFYYENLEINEIAEMVNLKPENVKVALSRARIRLRKELQDYEEELMS